MKINEKTVHVKSEVQDKYFLETEFSKSAQLTGIVLKDEKTLKDILFALEDQVQPIEYMSIDYQNKADAKVAEEVIQDIVQDY